MKNNTEYVPSGHFLLGLMAVKTLPQWERDLIRPDMSPQAMSKPYLPQGLKTAVEKMAAMCLIMDWVYYDECRPFATLPDGRWIPYSPPDANLQASGSSGLPYSPNAERHIIEMLMNHMVDEVRAGDWEQAIRWGGALGHFMQEPFTPGHAMNNRIFHELFPDPDSSRHKRLHHVFDNASDMFEPLPPRLMGTSVPEAAFRLQIEIDRGATEGKKLVPSIIQSVYAGLPNLVPRAILAPQCQKASFVTTSAWHTAISIALERFNEREKALLPALDLTQLAPYFWHACKYVDLLPGCLVQNEKKIPIHVWEKDAGAEKHEVLIEHGFGMGGHMGAKFSVNGDVFPRFQCQVGLPSRHLEGQTDHTDTRFFVEMDREENRVYSEDMEYHADRIREVQLVPGAPVCDIDVNIRGARSLILTNQCRSHKDAAGQIKWDVPHVAICEPRILKQ